MTTITQQCMELPIEERWALCRLLEKSVIKEKEQMLYWKDRRQRVEQLKAAMADVIGVDAVPLNSRIPQFVWARNMIAYQLMEDGCPDAEVGSYIGKSRCTMVHVRGRMQDALHNPDLYEREINIWKQFQAKINGTN